PGVLRQLVQDGVLVEEAKTVRLASYQAKLTPEQRAAADAYVKALSGNPNSPTVEMSIDPELLDHLVGERLVVKLAENTVVVAATYDEMVDRVVNHLRSRGKITVAEVRDLLQTSRKYALALMEHLDELKVTRRAGDERVLRPRRDWASGDDS
ncbi:MAG: SelB C-terminal domain-containing protein, partial [Chloroflexi bacterium]|nr:SelB C-terminal domain-containing protein [Chloroflexota bacterium]